MPDASSTLAGFACEGYAKNATTGELRYMSQATAVLGPLNAGDGIYWVALHADTTSAIAGWTRQPGTAYLWKLAGEAVNPASGEIFAKVTVAAGVVTVVEDKRVPASLVHAGVYAADDPLYGAICDNSADATAAMQATLDAAPSGNTVVLPPGICRVTSLTIHNRTGLTVRGAGAAVTNSSQVPQRIGTRIRAIGAVTSLVTVAGLSKCKIEQIGFDGNFLATNVLHFNPDTGPNSQIIVDQIVVERAVLTTGYLIKFGQNVNTQNDHIQIKNAFLQEDADNGAHLAAAAILHLWSNALANLVSNTIMYQAYDGISMQGGHIDVDAVECESMSHACIAIYVQTSKMTISNSYTETAGTYFLFQNDYAQPPPSNSFPALITFSRNIVNSAGMIPFVWNRCQPLLSVGNIFRVAPQILNGVCGTYDVTSMGDTFEDEFPSTTFTDLYAAGQTGFAGAGAEHVLEINNIYEKGEHLDATTHVANRWGGSLKGQPRFGSAAIGGGVLIQYHSSILANLSIAAPGAIPGCSDSADVTIATGGFGYTRTSLFVTLQGAVLPAGGQLSVHFTATDKAKIRWCQFTGGAVSPDGGGGANYRIEIWVH